MICIKTQHFNIHRILLLAIGVWPYHRSMLVRIQLILFFGILASYVMFQLIALITAGRNPELIIRILSSSTSFIFFLIKYHAFFNTEAVKDCLEQLQSICNKLQDENEIAIIRKYANSAKFFTIVVLLGLLGGSLVYFCLQFWPLILDVFQPINGSRRHMTLYIVTEYIFIDQEKYFYLIMAHMDAAGCIGIFAVAATGSLLIAYFKHACGMFRIVSYRIEQAMAIDALQNTFLKNEMTIYKEIIYAVNIHCKTMKYCDFVVSQFETSIMFLIVTAVSCLSINLFRLSCVLLSEDQKIKIILHLMSIVIILFYMFWGNYIGQEITDHNNHIFLTAYNVQWYTAPLDIQRMILFLLQRGNKAYNLNAGKLITASFECFASMVSASMSYFTVLYSTQ